MKKPQIITAALGLAVAAVAVAAGAWYFVLRGDAPPAVSLATAVEAVAVAADQPVMTSSVAASTGGLTGTWNVLPGSNTFAGYRVGENLVGIGATTAVGRTGKITGSLVYDGASITSVEISVDVSTLTSDKSMRDDQLKMQALETSKYPKATFVLTTPIKIDSLATGGTISQTVQGNLTLHGSTQPVSIQLEGQLVNGQVVVVGSTTIQFATFGISQPRSASVLSIDDHGTMEFQLVFAKAA